MADMEAVAARLEKAIGDALAAGEIDGGGYPYNFAIVGKTCDADGDYRWFFTSNCGIEQTIGLLDVGHQIQRQHVVNGFFEDD